MSLPDLRRGSTSTQRSKTMRKIGPYLTSLIFAFVIAFSMATVARSQKGDLPKGAREKAAQGDSSNKTATGYGYGGRVTDKDQSRLAPDKDYRGPVTDYRTIDPPTSSTIGTPAEAPIRTVKATVYVGAGRGNTGYRNQLLETYFSYREPSQSGHLYDVYNFIGHSNQLGAVQVFGVHGMRMSEIMRAEPLGSNDDRIIVGNKFNLHHYVDRFGWINAPVEVTAVSDTSFTVQTLKGHPLQGRVVHEVYKDANNNLWLHQHGEGVAGEPRVYQERAYSVAPYMWGHMAEWMRARVSRMQQ